MDGIEDTTLENCSYAADLGYSVPTREKTGVLTLTEEAERHCYKSDRTMWLSKVDDAWDVMMFQQAHNWDKQTLPDEVRMKLSNASAMNAARKERSWMSLLEFDALEK